MDYKTLPSAREMEDVALEAAAHGALVLTPASRLTKRYRHAYRMRRRGTGDSVSWRTPEIASLRRWVKACFDGLWAQGTPAGKAAQLALWAEAAGAASRDGIPPPEGLELSPALYSRLQDAHDLLHEHGLEEPSRDGTPVSEWRREVARRFDALARSRGLLFWHEVQETVRGALAEGRIAPPPLAVVLLKEPPAPGPVEQFLETLSARCETRLYGPPRPEEAAECPSCLVYATPEQECRFVCSEALAEWKRTGGSASLAIAVLDESYFPILERCLDELAARRPLEGKGEIRYNLAWGPPLTQHPLFHAAVFPLRLSALGDPVKALAALLRSPYADPGRFVGAEELFARMWGEEEGISLKEAVRAAARFSPALAPLQLLHDGKPAPLGEWTSRLRDLWKGLGFPWRAGSGAVRDQNAIAQAQLEEALADMEAHCGGVTVDAAGAVSWIEAMCGNQRVTEPTAEMAGIQVLAAGDVFGLSFDRVWVAGAHGDVLPRPRGAEPLLSPHESLAVAGGDLQSRSWEEARRLVQGLLASCPEHPGPVFTRAKSEPGGERPYLGSPFLADRFGPGEGQDAMVFDVWGPQRDLWLAAPWLSGAAAGLADSAAPSAPIPDAVPLTPPRPLSVTALDALLKCPFAYFAAFPLGLEPLPEPPEGVPPLKRGGAVHEILARFTSQLPLAVPEWPDGFEKAWELLRRLALGRLEREEGAYWSAELARLVGAGNEGEGGLLRAWLEAEREWALRGWRHETPAGEKGERPFRGLRMGGLEVEGRADRVDRHPELGRIVWDYKTGEPPTARQVLLDMTEAQLPAYLLALKAGLMDREGGGEPAPWTLPASAGYIPLKKPEKVALKPVKFEGKEGTPEEFLRRWREHVERRTEGPLGGIYPADPRRAATVPHERGTACAYCPFPALCGYFDAPRESDPEKEPEEEEEE